MNWLTLPSVDKLRSLAMKLGVKIGASKPWDLVIKILEKMSDEDIDKSPIFKDYYIFRREFNSEEIREKRDAKEIVPRSFVCHKAYVEPMTKWFDSHPDDFETAFSGYVMGSSAERIQFSFDKNFTCICGEEILMEKTLQKTKTDPFTRKVTVLSERQVDVGYRDCPNPMCNKTWRRLELTPNPTGPKASEEVNDSNLSK